MTSTVAAPNATRTPRSPVGAINTVRNSHPSASAVEEKGLSRADNFLNLPVLGARRFKPLDFPFNDSKPAAFLGAADFGLEGLTRDDFDLPVLEASRLATLDTPLGNFRPAADGRQAGSEITSVISGACA